MHDNCVPRNAYSYANVALYMIFLPATPVITAAY